MECLLQMCVCVYSYSWYTLFLLARLRLVMSLYVFCFEIQYNKLLYRTIHICWLSVIIYYFIEHLVNTLALSTMCFCGHILFSHKRTVAQQTFTQAKSISVTTIFLSIFISYSMTSWCQMLITLAFIWLSINMFLLDDI